MRADSGSARSNRVKGGGVGWREPLVALLSGGHCIVPIVTHESAHKLGLALGSDVFALIKSSSLIEATDLADVRFLARNQLSGTVSHIQPGVVNTEVVIDLSGALALAVSITNESAVSLDLKVAPASPACSRCRA